MTPTRRRFSVPKIEWLLAVKLGLLLTPLIWLAILEPFYQWVLFGQAYRRKVTWQFATRFLFTHG